MGSLLFSALLIGFASIGSAADFGPAEFARAQEITKEAQAEKIRLGISQASGDTQDVIDSLERLAACPTDKEPKECSARNEKDVINNLIRAAASTEAMADRDLLKKMPQEVQDSLKVEFSTWLYKIRYLLDALIEFQKSKTGAVENMNPRMGRMFEFYGEAMMDAVEQIAGVYGEEFVKPFTQKVGDIFDAYDKSKESDPQNPQ